MKKVTVCGLLICLLLFACVPSFAEQLGQGAPVYDYDRLTIGNPTQMTGSFFGSMFGNNTADLDVQRLLHDFNLVEWDIEAGGFDINNSVVSGVNVTENDLGDRTYTLALYKDLYYSDGTGITAWDYAFSILLSASPEMAAVGAQLNVSDCILGMAAYAEGLADTITGVRVMDDYLFSVTISHEYRPFFYEMGLLSFYPYPARVIAPGATVTDRGNGICFADRSAFTPALLARTFMNTQNGYLQHPSVVSGPYTLVSFDGMTAEFERNPWYKGNSQGQKPAIGHLTYTLARNDTMISELNSGRLGLINKVVQADSITNGIASVGEGFVQMSSYVRSGLSYISFCCERPAVQSQSVRQAMAYCLDKAALVNDYVGNYGLQVDGYYGIGQWMYLLLSGTEPVPTDEPAENASEAEKQAYQAEMRGWSELSLNHLSRYEQNTDRARQLLISDGWTLNENGTAFREGTDRIRCKYIDSQLVRLDLTMLYPEANTVSSALQRYFVEPLSRVGIRLTLKGVSTAELFSSYSRQMKRNCDMIYIATNFSEVFDPSETYLPDSAGGLYSNVSALNDEKLYSLAADMSHTEPGDLYGYCRKWVAFQEYWTEILPAIPIYSNAYFDFYTACLHDYDINTNVTWSEAILGAYMGDMDMEFTISDEDAEDEDGLFIFD